MQSLKLLGSRTSEDGQTIILGGVDDGGATTEVAFDVNQGEVLLGALVSALGQTYRQRSGDKTMKTVFPVEWWEINPHPAKDGMLFSYRLQGGMEMTFHIPAGAVPHYEAVLTALTGTRPIPMPEGPRN